MSSTDPSKQAAATDTAVDAITVILWPPMIRRNQLPTPAPKKQQNISIGPPPSKKRKTAPNSWQHNLLQKFVESGQIGIDVFRRVGERNGRAVNVERLPYPPVRHERPRRKVEVLVHRLGRF